MQNNEAGSQTLDAKNATPQVCTGRSNPDLWPCCPKHAAVHASRLAAARPVEDRGAAGDGEGEEALGGRSACSGEPVAAESLSDEQVGSFDWQRAGPIRQGRGRWDGRGGPRCSAGRRRL